jgi:hypothetical protein
LVMILNSKFIMHLSLEQVTSEVSIVLVVLGLVLML